MVIIIKNDNMVDQAKGIAKSRHGSIHRSSRHMRPPDCNLSTQLVLLSFRLLVSHKDLILINLVLGRLACRDTLLELFKFVSCVLGPRVQLLTM